MLTPIVHVSLAIYASGRREGDETLLYCASQSCVMLDTLVIFLPFQSGFNPRSWPRLTEFRRPEDTSGRGTLVTLVVAAVVFLDPSLQLPSDCTKLARRRPRGFSSTSPQGRTLASVKGHTALTSLVWSYNPDSNAGLKRGPGGWETSQNI